MDAIYNTKAGCSMVGNLHTFYSMLRSAFSEHSFSTSYWAVLFNPAYIARRGLAKSITHLVKQLSLDGSGVWLDVGCGSRPYESLFNVEKYIGMDVEESGHPSETKRYDIAYDGVLFPIDSCSIDGVICTQVLEHVPNPGHLISEIERVLKPGGRLLLTAPFVWQEHEKPYDFTRFSSYGLRHLLEPHFCILEHQKTTGSIETIAQALSIYLHNSVTLNLPGWSYIVTLALSAPIQIMGLLWQRIVPDKEDLFLDNAILAYKLGQKL